MTTHNAMDEKLDEIRARIRHQSNSFSCRCVSEEEIEIQANKELLKHFPKAA